MLKLFQNIDKKLFSKFNIEAYWKSIKYFIFFINKIKCEQGTVIFFFLKYQEVSLII